MDTDKARDKRQRQTATDTETETRTEAATETETERHTFFLMRDNCADSLFLINRRCFLCSSRASCQEGTIYHITSPTKTTRLLHLHHPTPIISV